MSMRNYGCSGYVAKAELLVSLLPKSEVENFKHAMSDHDYDLCRDICEKHLPKLYPCPESFFELSDEDESEDLERNTVYAFWDKDDLFVSTKRPETIALESIGVKPELNNWVTFG